MLNPARANSWTVASCSEPLGMPSLSAISSVRQSSIEAGALAGVADVAVPEPPDLEKHGVVVAVDEDVDDREPVAGRLAFHPQRLTRAAEERGEAAAPRFGEGDVVHEADHQHFGRIGVLDHGRNETVEFRIVHKTKNPAGWGGARVGLCLSSWCRSSLRLRHARSACAVMMMPVAVDGEHGAQRSRWTPRLSKPSRPCHVAFRRDERVLRRARGGASAWRAIMTSVDLTMA